MNPDVIQSSQPVQSSQPAQPDVKTFIQNARNQGISDDKIVNYLRQKNQIAQPAQAPAPSSPGADYIKGISDIPKNWWENVSGATQKAVKDIGEGSSTVVQGANDLSQGHLLSGAGKIAGGVVHGVAGGVTSAVGALFAPLSAVAKGITPKTGNSVVDDTTQAAVAGAPFGPEAAVVNGVFSLLSHARNAIENSPALKPLVDAHPQIASTLNDLMDIGALYLGGKKVGEAGGAKDLLNSPLNEAPGVMGENIKDTANATGIPKAVGDFGSNIQQGVKNAGNDIQAGLGLTSDGSDQSIINDYNKAIRPSVAGKGTSGQIDAYNKSVVGGVRRIAQNEPNLEFSRDGEITKGGLPESPKEMADAIAQTKQKIYGEYNARQQMAGMAGAKVDLSPISQELNKLSSDPVLQDVNPSVASYAKSQAETFSKRGMYSTDQAQQAIELYNKSLEAFYKNPSYDTASRAAVDSMVANKMRSALDSVIENAHEGDGESYQDLKKQYGALKSIEKDVAKRAVVAGRAAPHGMLDLSNIASGAELVRALTRLSPADFATSAAIKGVSEYMKWRNNPDTIIKRMFQGVKSANNVGDKSSVPNVGLSLRDVSKIHPDDQKVMENYIDAVRIGKEVPKRLDIDAENLRAHFGIPDVSMQKLANHFDKLLQGVRKK